MAFIKDDFMIKNKRGLELYEKYAKDMPIIDYHCHLSPEMIATDYRFKDAFELFLGGDHYKWRQMRSFGIEEKYITGDAEPYEKFLKWAELMPNLIGNPLYHWTTLELDRYFGIKEPLCPKNAKEVWDRCKELLALPEYSAKNLIMRSKVTALCTTDDPADDLHFHELIAQDKNFTAKVYPTFRPDKALEINKAGFAEYIGAQGIKSYDELLSWLSARVEYFAAHGCRISDHSLEHVPFSTGDAAAIFEKKLRGGNVPHSEENVYKTAVMTHLAKEYTKHGFAMQLHLGAMRNINSDMFEKLGADAGFDTANDLCVADNIAKLLNEFNKSGSLPKTILYSLNGKDNHSLATIMGSFQSAPTKGKLQLGSGWWFNDTRDGMENQLKTLAALGVLPTFVGMLTDSRSFVSYTRHDYFRRILCNLIGKWVEDGEYPDDDETLGKIISGICYNNAKEYFGF